MQQPWTHLQNLSHLWPNKMDAQHLVCFGIHHHLHHPLEVVVSKAVLQGTADSTLGTEYDAVSGADVQPGVGHSTAVLLSMPISRALS